MTAAPTPVKSKRAKRPQSFLRSKAAHTLDIFELASLDEQQSYERFKVWRYADNSGRPYCPDCGVDAINTFQRWNGDRTIARTIFKCKECDKQFTATSGTIFAYRKMSFRKILMAVALFIQFPKGTAALQIHSLVQCDYRVALVLTHKLREAMIRDMDSDTRPFEGEVEADTCWIGGHIRPKNLREEKDELKPEKIKKHPWAYLYLGPKKKSVTVLLERGLHGRVRTHVADLEKRSPDFIRPKVTREGTTLYTDQAGVYAKLDWDVRKHFTVNHSLCFWTGEANTNTAECFFSVLKRAVKGVYHHIAHPTYAESFTQELAWRFENRRVSNGDRFNKLLEAMGLPGRSKYKGMWQRRLASA
ncbi:MAG TPA: IS1595 family transposase [Rhizomicrobium sp.]|nr:IS1595 family transposase [Rhizomicrobium sp.]